MQYDLDDIKPDIDELIASGCGSQKIVPFLGEGYLCTPEAFADMFVTQFKALEFRGLECFTAHRQVCLAERTPTEQAIFLNYVEQLGTSLNGLQNSEHFLYVGQKISD